MRLLMLVVSAAFTFGFASSALGQSQSHFEKALHQNRYPTTLDEGICYAKTDTPNTFDLSRLCGSVSSDGYSGSYDSGSIRGGSSGICNVPSDIARDGSRCGGRAASERPGGRDGSSYTPSYSGSTGGRVYVRPYTRSDGTRVRGYRRSR